MTNIFEVRWIFNGYRKRWLPKRCTPDVTPFPFRWTIHFCASISYRFDWSWTFFSCSHETSYHRFPSFIFDIFFVKTTWYDLHCCCCWLTFQQIQCAFSKRISIHLTIWFWVEGKQRLLVMYQQLTSSHNIAMLSLFHSK